MTDRERQIRQNIRNAYCVCTYEELVAAREQRVRQAGRTAFEIDCLNQLIREILMEEACKDVANQEIHKS